MYQRMALFAAWLVVGCATPDPPMRMMSAQETAECEAEGGTIEPAYALNEYVCLLPATTPR
jgi:hypothetical protein